MNNYVPFKHYTFPLTLKKIRGNIDSGRPPTPLPFESATVILYVRLLLINVSVPCYPYVAHA